MLPDTVAASAWSPISRAARNAPRPINRSPTRKVRSCTSGVGCRCSASSSGSKAPLCMFAASGRPTPSEKFHSGTCVSCEDLMVELRPGLELPCRSAPVDPGVVGAHRHAVAGTRPALLPTEHAARDLPGRAERPVRERHLVVADEDDQAHHHAPDDVGQPAPRPTHGVVGVDGSFQQRRVRGHRGSVASLGGATAGAW